MLFCDGPDSGGGRRLPRQRRKPVASSLTGGIDRNKVRVANKMARSTAEGYARWGIYRRRRVVRAGPLRASVTWRLMISYERHTLCLSADSARSNARRGDGAGQWTAALPGHASLDRAAG